MKAVECEFESEVLAAARHSRWPGGVDASLRAHVAGCAVCADVVAIASAMADSQEEARASVVLPDPGYIWWRAQLRARREAAEIAQRPMTVAQILAFACAVGLLGACFGAVATWFPSALGKIGSTLAVFKMEPLVQVAMSLMAEHGILLVTVLAVVLLIPAAACLAILRD